MPYGVESMMSHSYQKEADTKMKEREIKLHRKQQKKVQSINNSGWHVTLLSGHPNRDFDQAEG